jgi:SAM-dependent methyltransferase
MDQVNKEAVKIGRDLFEKPDYWGYFKQVYKRFGLRAIDKQFRYTIRRPFSRNLVSKYAPEGVGLEIGVGICSVSPSSRTVLTDGFSEHANQTSLAKLIFDSNNAPFTDNTFSFLVSEHALEHVPNPIKMLNEWKRVLKPDGALILFMPHKERTFDKLRPRTKLEHLINDFKVDRKLGEDDEHIKEWIELVISKGMAAHYGSMPMDKMIKTGGVHLHVWVTQDMIELLEYVGFHVVFSEDKVPDREDTFVIVARK